MERAAYVLTRPPGHHAEPDLFGGYCFVNHAAVAAGGADAGIIGAAPSPDVDQFSRQRYAGDLYARRDVFFASLHGDPIYQCRSTLAADQNGEGEGLGFNVNFLPAGAQQRPGFAAGFDDASRCAATT